MRSEELKRQMAKTAQARFVSVLQEDFGQPPRVAQAVLLEAEDCLLGRREYLRPGQMRVVLVKRGARHGRALPETEKVEVVWTIDAGQEDREVLVQGTASDLRRVRIQRLLDEALAQGAVATQEDLAQALQVSARTIQRDCAALRQAEVYLPTRGNLQGIGRGQTHKAQIIKRWLCGETYDQLVFHTRHSLTSVQRYIQTFVRVVNLHEAGIDPEEIAFFLQIGQPLVADYLMVYAANDTPRARRRLAEQRARLGRRLAAEKGGRP